MTKSILFLAFLLSISISLSAQKNKSKDSKKQTQSEILNQTLDLDFTNTGIKEAKPMTEEETEAFCKGKVCLTLKNSCNNNKNVGIYTSAGNFVTSYQLMGNSEQFVAHEEGCSIKFLDSSNNPTSTAGSFSKENQRSTLDVCK